MVLGRNEARRGLSVCVMTNRFKLKQSVVWRVRVLDTEGKNLDAKALKNVVVQLPDGLKFDAKFGRHPKGKPTDDFWAVSWEIPETYPTGTIAYKVLATDTKGNTSTWEPFKVFPSQLTIVK